VIGDRRVAQAAGAVAARRDLHARHRHHASCPAEPAHRRFVRAADVQRVDAAELGVVAPVELAFEASEAALQHLNLDGQELADETLGEQALQRRSMRYVPDDGTSWQI
jgi:hypothetical protein